MKKITFGAFMSLTLLASYASAESSRLHGSPINDSRATRTSDPEPTGSIVDRNTDTNLERRDRFNDRTYRYNDERDQPRARMDERMIRVDDDRRLLAHDSHRTFIQRRTDRLDPTGGDI